MDAGMLKQYGIFKRLGFFGVEKGTRRGAAQFLRTGLDLLEQTDHMLWLTPEGRFTDVRTTPPQFAPGLGHLAARLNNVTLVPLAIEYTFWQERLPEVLVRFGAPVPVVAPHFPGSSPAQWTWRLEQALADTQFALARAAKRRQGKAFIELLHGHRGVGGIYDWWCSLKTWVRGEPFKRAHGGRTS